MFNDVEIQSWIDKHGTATSLTWLVFGTTKEEETNLLIKGLMIRLIESEIERSFALFADPIDEEQARAWNSFQGTSLSFVFAGDVLPFEELIVKTVDEGLDFLRYKYKYLGNKNSDSYV